MKKKKNKTKFIIKILLSLCLAILCLLSGCSNLLATFCTEIKYNENTYSLVHDWEINSNDYELKTVNIDGSNLNIRTYDDKSFIYCEDNGSVYHNNNKAFPKNDVINISKLTFLFSRDNVVLDSSSIVDEFVGIINSESQTKIGDTEYLCTMSVSYKGSPAEFYFANVCVDTKNEYWLQCTTYDSEYNTSEFYYHIPDDSNLFEVIKNKSS